MNHCDQAGAERLKARIEAYWRERGYAVEVQLVPGDYTQQLRSSRVDVRSNLVDGMPHDFDTMNVRRRTQELIAPLANPPPPDPPRLRPCMTCARQFLSQYRFNRLCDLCRHGTPARLAE